MAHKLVVADNRAERRDLKPSGELVEAVQAFLMEKFGMTKPPRVAGKILALIVELDGGIFPRRAEISKQLHCSPFSIDAALTVALARGLLTEEVAILDATTVKRAGVAVTHRRVFKPTALLRSGIRRHMRNAVRIAL